MQAIKIEHQFQVGYVIAIGKMCGMDLSHLRDEFEFFTVDGEELYVLTNADFRQNHTVFSTMNGPDFEATWQFTENPSQARFADVEKKV